jgi:hypothetical protein
LERQKKREARRHSVRWETEGPHRAKLKERLRLQAKRRRGVAEGDRERAKVGKLKGPHRAKLSACGCKRAPKGVAEGDREGAQRMGKLKGGPTEQKLKSACGCKRAPGSRRRRSRARSE